MAITLIATPGAANANTYVTAAEDTAYQNTRMHAAGDWLASGDEQAKSLILATQLMDAHFSGMALDVADALGKRVVYAWTGAPVDAVQALCWPRTGMVTRNGFAIGSTEIPAALKNAVSELAGQLRLGDRTLDNDVSSMGITSLKAGPVSLSFKDTIEAKVIPDHVINLLVPSWFMNRVSGSFDFEVL